MTPSALRMVLNKSCIYYALHRKVKVQMTAQKNCVSKFGNKTGRGTILPSLC